MMDNNLLYSPDFQPGVLVYHSGNCEPSFIPNKSTFSLVKGESK